MARLNSQWGSCKICAIQVCAGSIHETKAHVSEHTLPPQLTDSSLESLPIWWKLLICPNQQQWYLCGHSQSVGSGKKVSWSFICLKCFQDWSKLLKLVPTCKKLTECIVGKMGVLDTFLLTWDYSARRASATNTKGKGQTKAHGRMGNLGFTGWRDWPGGSSRHFEGTVLYPLTGTGAVLRGRFLWGEVWCLFYVLATTEFTFAKI